MFITGCMIFHVLHILHADRAFNMLPCSQHIPKTFLPLGGTVQTLRADPPVPGTDWPLQWTLPPLTCPGRVGPWCSAALSENIHTDVLKSQKIPHSATKLTLSQKHKCHRTWKDSEAAPGSYRASFHTQDHKSNWRWVKTGLATTSLHPAKFHNFHACCDFLCISMRQMLDKDKSLGTLSLFDRQRLNLTTTIPTAPVPTHRLFHRRIFTW